MKFTIFFVIIIIPLSIPTLAAKGDDSVDPFGRFYLDQKRLYYEIPGTRKQAKLELLEELERESKAFSGSPYLNGALVWIAQEYSTQGRANRATDVLLKVLESEKQNVFLRATATFELGLAYSRTGKLKQAEKAWLGIAEDNQATSFFRAISIERIRTSRMLQKNWDGVIEITNMSLRLGLGKKPILYDTLATAFRRTQRYAQAKQYYKQILDEHPDYRPKNRMIYIDKAFVVCNYENQCERIGYLRDMENILRQYETLAKEQDVIFAEVYQEYYNLGNLYSASETMYKKWAENMPISGEEAQHQALTCYFKAINGLKDLPKNKRSNICFESVVSGSYKSAVELLLIFGRHREAAKLIEEYLNHYHYFEHHRLLSAQRLLNNILFGGLDMTIRDDEIINKFGSSDEKYTAPIEAKKSSESGVQLKSAYKHVLKDAGDTYVETPKSHAGWLRNLLYAGIVTVAFPVLVVVTWKRKSSRHNRVS